jgi:methyl-accepting chemotaxis protein
MKLSFKNLSFRAKFVSLVTALVIAVSAVLLGFFYVRFETMAENWMKNRAVSVSQLLNSLIAPGLEFDDATGVENVLKELSSSPENAYAVVLGAGGKEFASWNGELKPSIEIPDLSEPHTLIQGEMMHLFRRVETKAGTAGTLIMGFSLQELNKERRSNSIIISLISLFVLLLGLVLAASLGTVLVRPVRKMTDTAIDIAKGNLMAVDVIDTRASGDDGSSNDEILELSVAMKGMADNLRKIVSEIMDTSVQFSASAEQISSSAGQIRQGADHQSESMQHTSTTMSQMAAQIEDNARNMTDLANIVDEIAASFQEMSATLKEAADNSDTLIQSVDDTRSTLQEMAESIDSVAHQVFEVNEVSKRSVEEASTGGKKIQETITSIEQRSSEISKIIQVIEDIADQINLLALNAAIEAARAGEAGKGFAVVADEVKRLAERSAQAAEEIRQEIQNVQSHTGTAVTMTETVLKEIASSIDLTSKLVSQTSTATENMAKGTENMLQLAATSTKLAHEIARSAKENSGTASEINKAIVSMNTLTQEVTRATEEQRQGVQMVVKAVESVVDVASQNAVGTDSLSKTAEGLTTAAGKLKERVQIFQVK